MEHLKRNIIESVNQTKYFNYIIIALCCLMLCIIILWTTTIMSVNKNNIRVNSKMIILIN